MFKPMNCSVTSHSNDCNHFQSHNEIVIRSHLKPGDLGWIVQRHGILYYQAFEWNINFEKLVMKIVLDFFTNYNPEYEKFWFAEYENKNVGFILLTRDCNTTAKLRLLLVEPTVRGRGVGTQLVDHCIEFAKSKSYSKVSLWTNHVLTDAAKIYRRKGFQLINQEKHCMFGPELIAQTYQLVL